MRRASCMLIAAALAGCGRDAAPASSGPPISIAIERAAAARTDHGLSITCDATLRNDTGAPVEVRTNFFSVFDGLSVVISSEGGQEIARRAYIEHQSPHAPDERPLSLRVGATTQALSFPIDGLRTEARAIRVKLVGGLPGTAFTGGLVSNELPVEVR